MNLQTALLCSIQSNGSYIILPGVREINYLNIIFPKDSITSKYKGSFGLTSQRKNRTDMDGQDSSICAQNQEFPKMENGTFSQRCTKV
jgi:hypothetical protein